MANDTQALTRERKSFSRIETSLPIPNLIDVQRRSYERFLQMNLLPEERARRAQMLPRNPRERGLAGQRRQLEQRMPCVSALQSVSFCACRAVHRNVTSDALCLFRQHARVL